VQRIGSIYGSAGLCGLLTPVNYKKMKVSKSSYFNHVIPGLQSEIMQVVNLLKAGDAMSIAMQIDRAFMPSICLFAHTVVLGDVVKIRDHDCRELVTIDAAEYGSSCCFAPLIEETDICSACKEHANIVIAE
jgi:hypothetical protein